MTIFKNWMPLMAQDSAFPKLEEPKDPTCIIRKSDDEPESGEEGPKPTECPK